MTAALALPGAPAALARSDIASEAAPGSGAPLPAGQIPGAPAPGQTPFGTPPAAPQPGAPKAPPNKKDAAKPFDGPLPLFPIVPFWTTDLGAAPRAAAGFDAEHAFVPLQSGQLAAISLETGALTWTQPFATTLPPAADQRRVFVVLDAEIVALDADDGHTLWRLPLPARAARRPVARGGWVVVTLEGGALVAIRGQDGHGMWTVSQHSTASIDPIIAGDRVYITSDLGLAALELLSGRKLWDRPLDGRATAAGRAHDMMYIGTAGRWFYAVEERNGRVRWRWRVAGEPIGVTADDRIVVALMLDHSIRAFKVGNGAQAWRATLLYRPFGGPVPASGVLLVAGHGPAVRAYHDDDGADAGLYTIPAPGDAANAALLDALAAAPHVRLGATIADDLMVLLTQRGTIHAARRELTPSITRLTAMPGEPVPVPGLPAAFAPPVPLTLLPGTPLTIPAPPPSRAAGPSPL